VLVVVIIIENMEKALEWWSKLPQWKKEKLADEEQWTYAKDIKDYQIKLIYDDKVLGY
jgi:hypothetical protein